MEYEFHTKPFNHQLETFNESRDAEAYAILWEQGTGKTKLAIDTACYLWEKGEIDAVLVVAPNGVHRNWLTDEMPAHVPLRIRNAIGQQGRAFWDNPKSKTKWHQRQMEQLLKHKGFAWLMISYDSFMTKAGKLFVWKFLRQRRCLYMLDEAHNVKTPNAKRTKSIVASGKYAAYRRILTGTPIATGPFDIYSQIRFLDEKFWIKKRLSPYQVYKFHFGEYFTRSECQEINGYDPGYDKLLRYRNLDELKGYLEGFSSRVLKEDVLDLPPKLYSKRYYSLTPEQKKLYDQLKEDFIAEVEDGKIIDGNLAIVRLLRFQQIICGYVYTEDENGEAQPVHLLKENPRLDLLKETVEGLSHPAIIWARFSKDIDQIMEHLGDRAVRYDGQVSDDEAAEAKRRFQAGEVQFFVGNPQKGKEGLTLVQARTMIYYSNSFKLIDRLQSEDRAHRIGQEHPVDYIDLVAPKTIDEQIVKNLRNKLEIAGRITGDDLKEWI